MSNKHEPDCICKELKTVCYHEAGHALIAMKYGIGFEELIVKREKGPQAPEWAEWDGGLKGVDRKLFCEKKKKSHVAIGGPIAEAKHKAGQEHHQKLVFDTSDSWIYELIQKIIDWQEEEENITVKVGFVSEGKHFEIDMDIFEDDIIFMKGKSPDSCALKLAVKDVMNLLDDHQIWEEVTSVANLLSEQTPTISNETQTMLERIGIDYEGIEKLLKELQETESSNQH